MNHCIEQLFDQAPQSIERQQVGPEITLQNHAAESSAEESQPAIDCRPLRPGKVFSEQEFDEVPGVVSEQLLINSQQLFTKFRPSNGIEFELRSSSKPM